MVIQTLGGKDNSGEVKKTHVYIAVVLIVIVAGIFLLFIPGKPACGNGVCGPEENCFDCPQDCKCMKGEYCSPEEKTCVKLITSVCGNNVCESDENCFDCPQDCGCGEGEYCSPEEKTCVKPTTSVCGNNVCESEENCFDCPQDCGCGEGEYCSPEEKTCVKSTPSVCGNNVCESDENCFNCPKDCGCGEGEYCSPEEKRCVKPTCGNGKCESYEDPYTCCLDCFCSIPGEICNEETKKCEKEDIAISDERAIELAVEYFENQGLEIKSTESLGVSSYDGKLIKKIKVQISGEVWFRYVGVTEDEEVIDLPAL